MTNRYPLSALLMKFSEQLRHTGIRPEVRWSSRETNAEAVRLANGDSTGFSPSLRVRVFPLRPPWYVLNEALEMGAQAEEQKRNTELSKAMEIFTRGGDASGSWRRSSASSIRGERVRFTVVFPRRTRNRSWVLSSIMSWFFFLAVLFVTRPPFFLCFRFPRPFLPNTLTLSFSWLFHSSALGCWLSSSRLCRYFHHWFLT